MQLFQVKPLLKGTSYGKWQEVLLVQMQVVHLMFQTLLEVFIPKVNYSLFNVLSCIFFLEIRFQRKLSNK